MRKLIIAAMASFLAGCSFFLGGEYTYLTLSESYSLPQSLPQASNFEQIREDWTRSRTYGLDGRLAVTLEDPFFSAAYVSWYSERGHLSPEALLAQKWANLYDGNRLPFNVSVVLPKRFYSKKQLDLSAWKFALLDDQGQTSAPIAIEDVEVSDDGENWNANFRIFFARTDFQGRPLFSRSRYLELSVNAPLERMLYRWRFRPRANG